MVDSFTTEQIAEFKQTFKFYDEDDSGTVDLKELIAKLNPLGKAAQDVEETKLGEMISMMGNVDKDRIAFPEFVNLMASTIRDDDVESELKKAYADIVQKSVSEAKSAPLTKNTFRRIFVSKLGEEVTDEELDRVLAIFDTDKKSANQITLTEFLGCMMK